MNSRSDSSSSRATTLGSWLTGSIRRVAVVFALIVACLVTAAPIAHAQDQGTEPSAFEAMDPETSRHKENLSGIPFMVGAYMAIWTALFGYLVLINKRQAKTDAEIAELRRALEAHDQRSSTGA